MIDTNAPDAIASDDSAADDSAAPWPSVFRAWFTVILLTAAYVLSFVDRQILTLLITPIQAALDIGDTQTGLLVGAAFAICYTTFGLPMGWLADRIPRVPLVAVGIAFWSVMTALCGMANTYTALFIARIGVGLGEAVLTPAAFSLLADNFPPHRLARAIGVYMSGAIIGISIAYVVGGEIVAWATERPQVDLPVIGAVQGWQAPFFILLLPGLLLAMAMMMLPEPPRRQPTAIATPGAEAGGVQLPVGLLSLLFLAMGAQSAVVYANLTWTPTLLVRRFGWAPDQIGWTIGSLLFLFGIMGNLGGAWAASAWLRRGDAGRVLRICLVSSGVAVFAGTLAPVAPAPLLVLSLLAVTVMMTSIPTAIVPTFVQMLTPGALRGRISALYLLATQLTGLVFGPALVAVLTDFVFKDEQKIGEAQSIAVLLSASVSVIAFTFAARLARRS